MTHTQPYSIKNSSQLQTEVRREICRQTLDLWIDLCGIVLGLALIAFALGFIAPATGFNWIGWIGAIPLVTAIVGSCPLS